MGIDAEGVTGRRGEVGEDVAGGAELDAATLTVDDEEVADVVDGKAEAGGAGGRESTQEVKGEAEVVSDKIVEVQGFCLLRAPVEAEEDFAVDRGSKIISVRWT